jgi:hypothetical protein
VMRVQIHKALACHMRMHHLVALHEGCYNSPQHVRS